MRNAFAAGTLVAVLAGPVGYALVLRGQSFAGHALAHLGFTGATGAVLLGLPPLWGVIAITALGGAAMGAMGEQQGSQRDVAIGVVLALALGLGVLFLGFFTTSATQATSLLFGNVLGVDAPTLWTLLAITLATLAALAILARPLLFASLQPELAEARGVPLRRIGVLFLALTGLAVAGCVQVVGVLLVFALLVAPAAAARALTPRLLQGATLATALALSQTWCGLALAWFTDWPVSFWISLLSAGTYVAATMLERNRPSPLPLRDGPGRPSPLPLREGPGKG